MSNASKQLYRRLCANDMHIVLPGSKRSKVEILERNCVHYFKTCQDVKTFALQDVSCALEGCGGGVGVRIQYCQCKSNPPPPFCSNNLDCRLFFTLWTASLELCRHLAQVACSRWDNCGVKPFLPSAGGNVSVRRTNSFFVVGFFLPQDERTRRKWVYSDTCPFINANTQVWTDIILCRHTVH